MVGIEKTVSGSKKQKSGSKPVSAIIARAGFGILLIAVLGRAMIAVATGNSYEVIPGVLYRSSQPTASDIRYLSEDYGIKSIVNLRDEERAEWYQNEVAAARKYNVQLINFPISSARPLSLQEQQQLISILKRTPKPILIHCEHGANRTGLVAAMFVKMAHYGDWYAEIQLSPYFGHIPIPGLGRYAMQVSWQSFKRAISGNDVINFQLPPQFRETEG